MSSMRRECDFYKKHFKKRSSTKPCQVKMKLIMLFYYIIWRGDIIEICSFMSLTVNNSCNSYFSLIITFFSCKPNLCFFKKNIFFLLLVKQSISMLPFDNREGADGKFRTGCQ